MGAPPPGVSVAPGGVGLGARMAPPNKHTRRGPRLHTQPQATSSLWLAFQEQFQAPTRSLCFVKSPLTSHPPTRSHCLSAFSVGPARLPLQARKMGKPGFLQKSKPGVGCWSASGQIRASVTFWLRRQRLFLGRPGRKRRATLLGRLNWLEGSGSGG